MQSFTPIDEIVAAVERLTAERGFPPTVRELAKATGGNMTTTQKRVEVACALGRLSREPGASRTLRVVA